MLRGAPRCFTMWERGKKNKKIMTPDTPAPLHGVIPEGFYRESFLDKKTTAFVSNKYPLKKKLFIQLATGEFHLHSKGQSN